MEISPSSEIGFKMAVKEKPPPVETLHSVSPPVQTATRQAPTSTVFQQSPEKTQTHSDIYPGFNRNRYQVRRKVFRLFGGEYQVSDPGGNVIFYGRQKPFRLREEFSVYPSKESREEILKFKTKQFIDQWATFEVEDPHEGIIGSVKRKWFKSLFKDEWAFNGKDGNQIGKITETSGKRAFFVRLLGPLLVPQKYTIFDNNGGEVARISQSRNPFVLKYDMEIREQNPAIDRRLIAAMGILLAGIEGRQNQGGSVTVSVGGNTQGHS